MSSPEEQELLLSQLVDQELPADEACQLLLETLDETEALERLKTMLQLRLAFRSWRQQEPRGGLVMVGPRQRGGDAVHYGWRLTSLAAAALLGGVLVAAGFYLGGRPVASAVPPSTVPASSTQEAPNEEPPAILVTSEQRHEIARVFALHESVAGPLNWYAADDTMIRVSAAGGTDEQPLPIAVVLRLTPARAQKAGQAKTYVIVCRNNDPAAIELPPSEVAQKVSFRLLPTAVDSKVNLQYAISADGTDRGVDVAALVGRRHVGLSQTSLGQLAVKDCLVNVDASSWVIRDERGLLP